MDLRSQIDKLNKQSEHWARESERWQAVEDRLNLSLAPLYIALIGAIVSLLCHAAGFFGK